MGRRASWRLSREEWRGEEEVEVVEARKKTGADGGGNTHHQGHSTSISRHLGIFLTNLALLRSSSSTTRAGDSDPGLQGGDSMEALVRGQGQTWVDL